MKTLAILLVVGASFLGNVSSGQAQANDTPSAPVVTTPVNPAAARFAKVMAIHERTLNHLFGMGVHYTGVVPMIQETRRPLQLINPFAPARYGNGIKNVSTHPVTGRTEGIDIFAIRF